MMTSPIPQNFNEWHHCITVSCGIELTPEFISKRLEVWRNEGSEETKRFRNLYGDSHWQLVISWFEQAERESGNAIIKGN
ncbi:MAG: hypothetical protein AAGB35_07670 [Pseudomonadota bacterium]